MNAPELSETEREIVARFEAAPVLEEAWRLERVHDLKVWPPYFDALIDGNKTFEVRRDDRGFQVGDVLRLREWAPPIPDWSVKGGYTGREVMRRVAYILDDAEDFGVMPGFVVLALAARSPATEAEEAVERVRALAEEYELTELPANYGGVIAAEIRAALGQQP